MNKGIKPVLVTGLMLLLSGSTYAASIGISFLGDGDDTEMWLLAPTAEAGVVPQAHWNNVAGTVGVADALVDAAGNPTAVHLGYEGNDAWNSDSQFLDSPNAKLMKGALKQGEVGSSMTLSFTNLADASYDVYVYGNVNGGPVNLDVSLAATTVNWWEFAEFDDLSGFLDATDPGNGGYGDYVKFLGVTPVSGGITVTATYLEGGDGLGISGLQIVSPTSFPTNAVPVAITGQPQPALATPGGTAAFAVQVTGPFSSYQWFKDDVLIPGATDARYTTPPLTPSDETAKYKVTVSNNVNSVTSNEAGVTVMEDPGTRVASIGVSFLGDGDPPENGRLAPDEEAGLPAVAQTNWNNIVTTGMDSGAFPPEGGLSDPLVDDSGNLTVVQLHFKADDAWNSDGTTNSPNEKLMKGILKNYPGSSMALTFTNLPPAFYDVYLYGNVNGGPMDQDVSLNDATNYWTAPAAYTDDPGFVEAASTDPEARAEGNYIQFIGVTPVSGSIRVTATHVSGADGAAIAGLQVVSSVAFPTGSEAPPLSATLEGNEIVISWDSPASFQLQYRTALEQGDWADEPTPPEITGSQVTVRLPTTDSAMFFRLRSD